MFDMIMPSAVASPDAPRQLGEYDAIILTDMTEMSDRLVSVIDAYVKNGGKLLVTGFPGVRDEMGAPVNRIRLRSLGVIPEIKDFEMVVCLY